MLPCIHSHRFYFRISIIIPTGCGIQERMEAAYSIKVLEGGLGLGHSIQYPLTTKRGYHVNICKAYGYGSLGFGFSIQSFASGPMYGGRPIAGSLLFLPQLSLRCFMASHQRALTLSRSSWPLASGRVNV